MFIPMNKNERFWALKFFFRCCFWPFRKHIEGVWRGFLTVSKPV